MDPSHHMGGWRDGPIIWGVEGLPTLLSAYMKNVYLHMYVFLSIHMSIQIHISTFTYTNLYMYI
jgi:hypothetical protein